MMNVKKVAIHLVCIAVLAPLFAQAEENPWMFRVRAVDLLFKNGQSGGDGTVQALSLNAQNQVIPEFDVTYFFTKNISAELVLTYPQNVSIGSTLGNIGTITALPPSLIAQYHFTDYGNFIPYVGVGINYTIFGNRSNFPGLSNTVQVNQSSVGAVGQIGFDYMFNKNWGLNIDLKYITMATDVTNIATGVNNGTLTLNPWAPAIGITYKF